MNKCIKCGSHAFNLYKEGIDQGGLCDVHYWQGRAHRAEALAEHPAPVQKSCYCPNCEALSKELTELKAQPEQEPVAWNDENVIAYCLKRGIEAAKNVTPQRKPPEWYAQWIRNNYQDHSNIATLCEEMTKAARGIKGDA